MTGFTYWIQKSDFSSPLGLSEDEPVESLEQILTVFREFDWAPENLFESRALENDQDCCPAGMGIVQGPGIILHICPEAKSNTALIHIHSVVPAKRFGIFKSSSSSLHSFKNVPMDKAEEAIGHFLRSDHDAIIALLAGFES